MIKGKDKINHLYDLYHIVVNDRCKTIYIYDGDEMTFNDIVDIAKAMGYTNGTILLICESALKGSVYRFNNYGENEWIEIGSTKGYA